MGTVGPAVAYQTGPFEQRPNAFPDSAVRGAHRRVLGVQRDRHNDAIPPLRLVLSNEATQVVRPKHETSNRASSGHFESTTEVREVPQNLVDLLGDGGRAGIRASWDATTVLGIDDD